MGNKRYLDKVLDHMVRNTEIKFFEELDYNFWFGPLSTYLPIFSYVNDEDRISPTIFLRYCVRQFGLTEEETQYVWVNYIKTMVDKYHQKQRLNGR